jgi:hypothetical protein
MFLPVNADSEERTAIHFCHPKKPNFNIASEVLASRNDHMCSLSQLLLLLLLLLLVLLLPRISAILLFAYQGLQLRC